MWFAFPGKLAGGKAAALHVWELLACESGDDRYVCNSVHLMYNCALFNAYQCDETAADGLSTPLGSLQSTLPDSQGSQPGDGLEDVGCIGQGIQKVKVIFASIQNMSFDFTRNYCFITK